MLLSGDFVVLKKTVEQSRAATAEHKATPQLTALVLADKVSETQVSLKFPGELDVKFGNNIRMSAEVMIFRINGAHFFRAMENAFSIQRITEEGKVIAK